MAIHDNSLVVRGEKRFEREDKGRTYFFSEREYAAFQRTFRLPADADTDKIDPTYSDGILCLKVAKKSASAAAGKTISIRRA